jgi:hypothetical protein
MSRTRLEWAQWMASKGITAFIVDANSKRPLGGNSWYVRNTTEPQQLADWFEETEDCNYGLWLGEEYVVIDLDVKHDTEGVSGIAAFEAICAENGISNFLLEFNTLMVETPSGGYHLYFKTPRPCANKNTFPALIDVRGAVGYVVGPGSKIKKGEWSVVDDDMPIMDIPEFLLDYLVSPGVKDPNHSVPLIELDQPENIKQALEWLREAAPAIAGENGDDRTYDVCCMLRDFGISESEALNLLNESGWNERCEPAWDSGELEVKIKNSYAFGQNRPGCKAETYKVHRLQAGRPAGGWGALITDEQVAAMFGPKKLRVVVDNTAVDEDDEIPDAVVDTDDDPMDEFADETQLWYGIQDFAAIDKVREYLVKGWLIAHGVTALLAARGTGKSTIALDLGMHLAKDMDWWGIDAMRNWKVIYICGEDDEGMILNVRAWAKYNDRGLPDNDRFLVARDIIKMTNQTELSVRLKEMTTWAAGARCLVILDTWARATSGYSSNTQEEMDTAYENAEKVAAALQGPMIACFHPPKDGRMTIRGSAVQEDASSGIWELVEQNDGIKLTIGRAKGKGRGNYRNFRLKPLDLEGFDAYGDKLQGIVPVKHGGTEDEGTKNYIEQKADQRRAWAKAVIGALEVFPAENPEIEKCSNTASGIAKFLVHMWINRQEDYSATGFCADWMDELVEHEQMANVNNEGQWKQVNDRLNSEFLISSDSQPVVVGEYTLKVEKKASTKNKNHFVIGATKAGIEE